ncbi:hypothetical protein ACOI1A_02530, partial [Corynebacterium glutamicum]
MDEQRAFDQGFKEENTLITDLTTCARLSHNKALRLIKLSKSTAYYRNKPRPCPASRGSTNSTWCGTSSTWCGTHT